MTFKFAADADCAVVDTQHFPGPALVHGPSAAWPKRTVQFFRPAEASADGEWAKFGKFHAGFEQQAQPKGQPSLFNFPPVA